MGIVKFIAWITMITCLAKPLSAYEDLVGLNREYVFLAYQMGEHDKLQKALNEMLQNSRLPRQDMAYALKCLGAIHASRDNQSQKARIYFWRMLENDPLADIRDLEDDPAVISLFSLIRESFSRRDSSILKPD